MRTDLKISNLDAQSYARAHETRLHTFRNTQQVCCCFADVLCLSYSCCLCFYLRIKSAARWSVILVFLNNGEKLSTYKVPPLSRVFSPIYCWKRLNRVPWVEPSDTNSSFWYRIKAVHWEREERWRINWDFPDIIIIIILAPFTFRTHRLRVYFIQMASFIIIIEL